MATDMASHPDPSGADAHAEQDTVMVPTSTTAADAPTHPATDGASISGLTWQITSESNPFHRRLLVTQPGSAALDLLLDPLVIHDLVGALTQVQSEQRRALGIDTAAIVAPTPTVVAVTDLVDVGLVQDADDEPSTAASTEPNVDSEPDVPAASAVPVGGPLTLGWWWQHKLLAFLLIFAAVFAAVGAVTGHS